MDEDRAELLGRLFALLTAKLEDAAALAAEGQSAAIERSVRERLAQSIRQVGEEVEIIASAAEALATQT